jgi:hypothetical protein
MKTEDARKHLQTWIDNSLSNRHSWATFTFGWSCISSLPEDERAVWALKRSLVTTKTFEERRAIAEGNGPDADAARDLVADAERLKGSPDEH